MSKLYEMQKNVINFTRVDEILRYWENDKPDQIVFTYLQDCDGQEENITYHELSEKAKKTAGALQRIASQGSRVLLLLKTGLDYIEAFFGCVYASMIVVTSYDPVASEAYYEKVKKNVKSGGIDVILTNRQSFEVIVPFLAKDPSLHNKKWLFIDEIEDENVLYFRKPDIQGNTIFMIQYTSGSTSDPKGVVITHRNIISNVCMDMETLNDLVRERPVGVGWIPLSHNMGILVCALYTMCMGGRYIFMSPATFFQKPVNWLKMIDKYKATFTVAPNTAYEICANMVEEEDLKTLDLSHLYAACCGSEPVRVSTLDKFYDKFKVTGFEKKAFSPGYGMAEATVFVAGGQKGGRTPFIINVSVNALAENRIEVMPDGTPQTTMLIGCGMLSTYLDLRIVDPDTLEVYGEDRIGEIWIKGDCVAGGYWNEEEKTKETFGGYLPNGDGPFLKSGDLGFVHEEILFITGRKKDMIIVCGKNHYPQDIEFTVEEACMYVQKASSVAFSVENTQGSEEVVIVSEIQEQYMNIELDFQKMKKEIRMKISEKHGLAVKDVLFIAAGTLPRTSSNKIQRRKCKLIYEKKQFNLLG